MKNLVVVDGDEDRSVLCQKIAGEGEALEHEFQPHRMPPRVILLHEAVVIDEVPVPRVVGRIDVDALHLPGVSHFQSPQRVEIVAFDDQVFFCSAPRAKLRHFVQRHKIRVQCPVLLDRILLPNQPEFFAVTRLQQRDELFMGEITIILAGHGAEGGMNASFRWTGS